MYRGIARLDALLLAVGGVSRFLWTLAGAQPAPHKPSFRAQPAAFTLTVESPDPEALLLPVLRFNIGLVDGKPGDLADLKLGSVLPAAVLREAPHGSGPDLADLEWGSVLSDTDLRGADWRGEDLRGVTLRNVDLQSANLQGVDLRGATLENTNLADAILAGARLEGADLRGARLFRSFSAGFCGHIGYFANLRGARYDAATRWPKGFDPQAHGAILDE